MSKDLPTRLRRWTHDVDAVPASDLMDEAAAEIERLRAERRWISVEKRLPDDETELLVAFEDRLLGVAFAVFHHLDENDGPKWTDGNGIELKQPTHWMPLPAPPTDAK